MTVEKKDDLEATPNAPSAPAPAYEPPAIVRLGSLHDLLGKSGRQPDNRANPTRP